MFPKHHVMAMPITYRRLQLFICKCMLCMLSLMSSTASTPLLRHGGGDNTMACMPVSAAIGLSHILQDFIRKWKCCFWQDNSSLTILTAVTCKHACVHGWIVEHGKYDIAAYLQSCNVEGSNALRDLLLTAAPRQHSVHSVNALKCISVCHAQQQGQHQPNVNLPAAQKRLTNQVRYALLLIDWLALYAPGDLPRLKQRGQAMLAVPAKRQILGITLANGIILRSSKASCLLHMSLYL